MAPERIFPTDRPSRSVRTRQASIASVDPNDPTRYFINFNGFEGAEPARYYGEAVLTVGSQVTVEVAPELHMWRIVSVPTLDTSAVSMSITKIWNFEPTLGLNHSSNVAPHPLNKAVVFVGVSGDGSLLYSLNWQTQTIVDTVSFNDATVKWVAPSPDGTMVAVCLQSAPYIGIVPIDVDGNFGSVFSDPGTLPPATGHQICWAGPFDDPFSADVLFVVMDADDDTDPITVYPVTGGAFGTKIATVGSVTAGWGQGPIGDGQLPLLRFGVITQSASCQAGDAGIAVSPSGDEIVRTFKDNDLGSRFIRSIPFSPATGFGSDCVDSIVTWDNFLAYIAYPRFHPRGHLLAWASGDSGFVGSSERLSNAFVQSWRGVVSPNLPSAMPLVGRLAAESAVVDAFNFGLSWRPTNTKDQLLIPVYPSVYDTDQTEVRLVLATIEGENWREQYHFIPDATVTDNWYNSDGTATCWIDKNTLIVIPESYAGQTNDQTVMLVIRVNGE